MILKIADLIIEAKSRYRYTYDLCRDYLYNGDKPVDFVTFATNEQLKQEAEKTPQYSLDVIENTCIYRNICNEILRYNGIFIHAAAICVDNKAYLFTADSGTGKTTHMNLWLDKFGQRAAVINGDKPIIRKTDGIVRVYGTPWCGKEGINNNICAPLKAICILEQSPVNTISVEESKNALMFLITQTQRPKEPTLTSLMYDNLGMILDNTKIYRLKCNMEKEACEVAYSAMK